RGGRHRLRVRRSRGGHPARVRRPGRGGLSRRLRRTEGADRDLRPVRDHVRDLRSVQHDPARRRLSRRRLHTWECRHRRAARGGPTRGVDRPFYEQYAKFVWRLVRTASFGTSWTGISIDDALGSALGGVILLLLLAIPLGVISALNPNTLLDRGI